MGLAFLTSFSIAFRRHKFEVLQKNLEIGLTYDALRQVSMWRGRSLDDTLELLKNRAYISSIILREDTLRDFIDNGKVTFLKGSEVINMYRVGNVNDYILTHLYKQLKVQADHFYMFVETNEDYSRIQKFLTAEFGKDRVKSVGRWNVLDVAADREHLLDLGLGISKEHLEKITEIGFRPILLLKNSPHLNNLVIKRKLSSFISIAPDAVILFDPSDKAILGYPNYLDFWIETILKHNLMVGHIEFSSQQGMNYLAKSVPSNIVRVHHFFGDAAQYASSEQVKARYKRSSRERGIRIFWLEPLLTTSQSTSLWDYNINFLSSLYQEILSEGFILDKITPSSIVYESASDYELLIMSLGVLASMVFLCSLYFPKNYALYALVSGGFLSLFCILYLIGKVTTWNEIMALLVAVIFPVIAMVAFYPKKFSDKLSLRALKGLGSLLAMIMVSLLGSVLIVGFLSDILFLKAINIFFGVKISFLLPIILVGLFFYLTPSRMSSFIYVFKRLLAGPISTPFVMMGIFFLIFIGVFFLSSINHREVRIFPFEFYIRYFLENVFYLRPRSKEIFLGYPLLVVSFFLVDKYIPREKIWGFNMLGVIAFVSLINSFCHLHTPLIISLYRSLLGAGIGVFIGFIYLLGLYCCLWGLRRLG